MTKRVHGIYRNGKVELLEKLDEAISEAPVIVTFLEGPLIDLSGRGIDRQQAAQLRERLTSFTEDWDSPEMQIYDDYDTAKSGL